MALTIPDARWMYFCEAVSWDLAEQNRRDFPGGADLPGACG